MPSVPVEIILFKVWRPSWSWTRGQAQRRLDAKVATWELRTPALATEITLGSHLFRTRTRHILRTKVESRLVKKYKKVEFLISVVEIVVCLSPDECEIK